MGRRPMIMILKLQFLPPPPREDCAGAAAEVWGSYLRVRPGPTR
jgi:hypothetical protein